MSQDDLWPPQTTPTHKATSIHHNVTFNSRFPPPAVIIRDVIGLFFHIECVLLPQAPQKAPPGYCFWGYQQANAVFFLLEPNSPLAFSSRLPQPYANHWSPLTRRKKSVVTLIHCLESHCLETILTAETEQIVVHVISVTLKQLDRHIHHVLKGLHLAKKDSNNDTHSIDTWQASFSERTAGKHWPVGLWCISPQTTADGSPEPLDQESADGKENVRDFKLNKAGGFDNIDLVVQHDYFSQSLNHDILSHLQKNTHTYTVKCLNSHGLSSWMILYQQHPNRITLQKSASRLSSKSLQPSSSLICLANKTKIKPLHSHLLFFFLCKSSPWAWCIKPRGANLPLSKSRMMSTPTPPI